MVQERMGSIPPPVDPGPGYESPMSAPKSKNPSLTILLIVGGAGLCLCFPILAAILFPVFSQAKQAAVRTEVLSNMKFLALGAMIYSGDYDDHLPHLMSDGQETGELLAPYLRESTTGKLSFEPLEGEFVTPNPELAGIKIQSLERPDQTEMFWFESEKLPGYRFVAYADGSARTINLSKE